MRIDEEYIVSMAVKLVRINSENPPGREAEIASFLAERISELGLKAKVDRFNDRANCQGSLRWGEGARILLLTHLDTVPAGSGEAWSIPPFEGVTREGRVYGRGAADAKGSIASMLGALKAIVDSGLKFRGEVIFAAVADEEVESQGVRRLLASGLKADYAVVGEPTNLQVCIAHKGRLVLSAKFIGRQAHSSMPDQGINALYAASDFTLNVESLSRKLSERKHHLLGSPTIAVTVLRGGEKDNMIPDSSEVLIDRRVLPGEALETALEGLRRISERSAKRYGARSELRIVRWVPPAETDSRSKIAMVAAEAVRRVSGIEAKPRGFQATCDMSFLVNQAHIPSIILGPGGLEQAHSVDEWVSIRELVAAAEIYSLIISEILCQE